MKKLLIKLIAMVSAVSTAVLIDVCYCTIMKDKVYSSTQVYTDCLVIGLTFFSMAYTYSFFKEKLQQLW